MIFRVNQNQGRTEQFGGLRRTITWGPSAAFVLNVYLLDLDSFGRVDVKNKNVLIRFKKTHFM